MTRMGKKFVVRGDRVVDRYLRRRLPPWARSADVARVKRRRRLPEVLHVVENLLVAAAGSVLDVGQRTYLALHLELNLLVNDLWRVNAGKNPKHVSWKMTQKVRDQGILIQRVRNVWAESAICYLLGNRWNQETLKRKASYMVDPQDWLVRIKFLRAGYLIAFPNYLSTIASWISSYLTPITTCETIALCSTSFLQMAHSLHSGAA